MYIETIRMSIAAAKFRAKSRSIMTVGKGKIITIKMRTTPNANMISLGQRMMTLETALLCVKVWLETPFEGDRHQRRIEQIDGLFENNF